MCAARALCYAWSTMLRNTVLRVLLGAALWGGCATGGAFDAAVRRRDLPEALRLDRVARRSGGVSETRLVALAELTLLAAARGTDPRAKRLAFSELASLGERGDALRGVLEREGTRPDAPAAGAPPSVAERDPQASSNAMLVDALWATDPTRRARAALLLHERGAFEALRKVRLQAESDRHVRLLLALGLMDARPADAWPVLLQLAEGTDVPAAGAAGELAARGDRDVVRHLSGLALSASLRVRVVAIRALARAKPEPQLLPNALLAPEAEIRIAAAGAILHALHGRD